ncbi:MAG TPA: shikimate kinase [Patescibacteria group bacterium]|nr:shikimate kinase [Patescibacteria group bacterium]
MNIALFGFMAVGKSSVGRILAEKIGMIFIDLDAKIEEAAGRAINEIFAVDGEEAFRSIERTMTREYAERDGQVIACGGGTVIDPENLECLRRSSTMILLSATPEEIMRRVETEDDTRPLLRGGDKLGRITSLLDRRKPAYMMVADYIVDTSGCTPGEVAELIRDTIGGGLL